MPTDIYSRNTTHGGSFSADSVGLLFPAAGIAQVGQIGLLAQNLAISYRQMITRLYEIGSAAVFYVGGRTQGDGSLGRVIGPQVLNDSFYTRYGNVCNAGDNILEFRAGFGCGTTANVGSQRSTRVIAYFVVLNNLALQINAEQIVITENAAFTFGGLQYNTNS